MNRQDNKLTQREKEEAQDRTRQHSDQRQAPLEFKTAEEALRHDRAQTPVPPVVAQRLNESVQELPKPRRSWWQFWR